MFTACGIMNRRCCRPVAWMRWNAVPPHPGYRPALQWVHYTTSCNTESSAPEDERNYRPKHVELIGIINKLLLLHLVGCLYYCFTIYLQLKWFFSPIIFLVDFS